MFTSFVPNFLGFAAIGVILVAMIGVGVAELSGLVGGLIRKLVAISKPASLTYIIVFVGILSSVAADAGYLVLIPLAATAFLSVGRNPLAGIAAGFGAVSAAFSVNVLIVPADAVVTDITNEASALVDPNAQIDLVSNLYFGIGCTLFLTVVIALIAIARAMAAKPTLLLYDEPTTGLDPLTSLTIDAEIIKLRDFENVTSVLVTHQLRDAFYVARHQAVRAPQGRPNSSGPTRRRSARPISSCSATRRLCSKDRQTNWRARRIRTSDLSFVTGTASCLAHVHLPGPSSSSA